MPLEIVPFVLGPMENNTYLLADSESGQAVVIDPSFDSQILLDEVARRSWKLQAVWLTHAHFDHIAGVRLITSSAEPTLPVGLHPYDLPLWRDGGGARMFGIDVEAGVEPALNFSHGQSLQLGSHSIEVRHAPGHTPGHVIFYLPENGAALVGDVIFFRGIGRTDLPGGSLRELLQSIRAQVMTLPPETILFSGHGAKTSVADEQRENPFL